MDERWAEPRMFFLFDDWAPYKYHLSAIFSAIRDQGLPEASPPVQCNPCASLLKKMTKTITPRQMPWILLWAGSSALVCVAPAIAQPVAIDGSTNTTIINALTGLPSDCSVSCLIQGTDQAGGNLFHSLSEFNVPSGVTVTFDGAGADRILSRVTGMNPSQIDGLLQVQGNADLFLLNPAGIVIGPSGRLDLQGSFISSTAEQLQFENGDAFSTLEATAPLLSVSVPSGLQFGTNNTAGFVVQGDSSRPPLWQPGSVGETLALVADTNNTSSFSDRSHDITAGGVVLGNVGFGDFKVQLSETNQGWDFDFSNVTESRPITFHNSALTTLPASPGGSVQFYANSTLSNSDVLLQSYGELPAGNFEYDGSLLQIMESNIETFSNSRGGDIRLSSLGSIQINDDSLLSVESDGEGIAGNISLTALGSAGVQVVDSKIFSTVESDGGDVSIVAPSQIVLEGGELITSTLEDGANVSLKTNGNLDLKHEHFISLNSGDGINSGLGGILSIEALRVRSVGTDTDIKVVGPANHFQTSITSNFPFSGFSTPRFTDVIRGNGKSEIQRTALPPFPPPLPVPSPAPAPTPPPEPTPVAIQLTLPSLVLQPALPVVVPSRPAPRVDTVVTALPSPERTEETDDESLVLIPTLLPEEKEEVVVDVGSAYRVRRSRCETESDAWSKGYLAVTGRGGVAESPGSSLLQSSPLADLGHSDFSWISRGRSKNWIQREQNAAKISSHSQLVEAGSWSINSGGNIQLVARGRVNMIAAVQSCQLEGKNHDT